MMAFCFRTSSMLIHFFPQAYEEEIAGTIAMLCTPDCAWTTGSVISSNGGFKFSY